MEDKEIVTLYWDRNEEAIRATDEKYGGYCGAIAERILESREDAEECVSDTWLAAWNAIPPHRPGVLRTFLGKLTRRLSIDRWRRKGAQKRGGGELELCLEELSECVAGGEDAQTALERAEMERVMARFLKTLPRTEKQVFLRRYWALEPISAIAKVFTFTEAKTTSMLRRTRSKLRAVLEKEGFLP